ncbi:hypothetical protein TBLA_0C04610 [Henningerozyma blattae CBS 6284]|uniref:INO2 bHLH domain-containing protein n=1 Tax=Henningerozyma blattae (strain ATCC 34711 / CBS 6284 / DSM 70876 / NBRC 10599 / NRRL Y-10934 / UCD 77-7) TaxID=1071380 RepID=I2H1K5_HENB6|nr:hypothetical protein TBLA_0C04610 [Tetrapisispora blattae CBS 6284]CCH60257.1 hypothetical protein TBLA_0C04610 [Tetrapisispora blattae CBS 6284]
MQNLFDENQANRNKMSITTDNSTSKTTTNDDMFDFGSILGNTNTNNNEVNGAVNDIDNFDIDLAFETAFELFNDNHDNDDDNHDNDDDNHDNDDDNTSTPATAHEIIQSFKSLTNNNSLDEFINTVPNTMASKDTSVIGMNVNQNSNDNNNKDNTNNDLSKNIRKDIPSSDINPLYNSMSPPASFNPLSPSTLLPLSPPPLTRFSNSIDTTTNVKNQTLNITSSTNNNTVKFSNNNNNNNNNNNTITVANVVLQQGSNLTNSQQNINESNEQDMDNMRDIDSVPTSIPQINNIQKQIVPSIPRQLTDNNSNNIRQAEINNASNIQRNMKSTLSTSNIHSLSYNNINPPTTNSNNNNKSFPDFNESLKTSHAAGNNSTNISHARASNVTINNGLTKIVTINNHLNKKRNNNNTNNDINSLNKSSNIGQNLLSLDESNVISNFLDSLLSVDGPNQVTNLTNNTTNLNIHINELTLDDNPSMIVPLKFNNPKYIKLYDPFNKGYKPLPLSKLPEIKINEEVNKPPIEIQNDLNKLKKWKHLHLEKIRRKQIKLSFNNLITFIKYPRYESDILTSNSNTSLDNDNDSNNSGNNIIPTTVSTNPSIRTPKHVLLTYILNDINSIIKANNTLESVLSSLK